VHEASTPSSSPAAETAQEPPSEVAAVSSAPLAAATKPDYGWLAELMAKWVGNLEKRYPVSLRTEGIQGKVTLIAVLHDDGRLSDIRVTRSSGNDELDRVAVEDVTKGAPIVLSRPLERSQMPVKLSLVYDLRSTR
jgi:TonB family protein